MDPNVFQGNNEHPFSQYRALYHVDASEHCVSSSFVGALEPIKKLPDHVVKLNISGSSLTLSRIFIDTVWTLQRTCLFIVVNDANPPLRPIAGTLRVDSLSKATTWETQFPKRVIEAIEGNSGRKSALPTAMSSN